MITSSFKTFVRPTRNYYQEGEGHNFTDFSWDYYTYLGQGQGQFSKKMSLLRTQSENSLSPQGMVCKSQVRKVKSGRSEKSKSRRLFWVNQKSLCGTRSHFISPCVGGLFRWTFLGDFFDHNQGLRTQHLVSPWSV